MFNKFFIGTADDLLNRITNAPLEAIKTAADPDALLNRGELIATVMDDLKIGREEAEKIVTEIQLMELDRISQGLVKKGFLEVTSYDNDGQPVYGVTELGKKYVQ